MTRLVSDRCASCGIAFIIGPGFEDYIGRLKARRLLRTLNFDYRFYSALFVHVPKWGPDGEVTLDDCDSIFLGDVIDPDMKCPKCGMQAFAE